MIRILTHPMLSKHELFPRSLFKLYHDGLGTFEVPAPCVASRLGNLFEVHKVLEDIRGASWFAKFSSITPGIGYERAVILPFPIRHNF